MAQLKYRGDKDSKIGLIFAHPEYNDIIEGDHLTTKSGRFMKHCLYDAGIKPFDCYIDYLMPSFPGQRGFTSIEAQDELEAYRPLLEKHLNSMPNLKVIVLVGPHVPPAFGITDALGKVRGFVFDTFDVPVICTMHPQSLFNGNGEQDVTFMNDLAKAGNIALNGFKRPKEDFLLEPTITDVANFLRPLVDGKTRLYVDIEAIGSLNERDHNTITMVGIGNGTTGQVMVIPFKVQGGGDYWSNHDERRVRKAIQKVLTQSPCVFHNAEYDCKHLNYQGLGPVRIGGDTMLLHHALHPELPHSLDYVTSVYGNIPYWKATLKKAKHQLEVDNIELRTYNARDCLAMMQIEDELIRECKDQGTYKIYDEISGPMLPIVLEMNDNGLPVDATRLITWRSTLTARNASILDTMSKLWQIHPAFNWSSGQHMGWLFYGTKPATYAKRQAEYAEYFEPGCKKKKTTKKFAALEEYIAIFRDTKPFRSLTGLTIKKTKSGASTDDEMRKRITEAIIRRTEKLINLVRKTDDHFEEQTDLAAMRQVTDNLMEYSTNGKLISTYTKLHIEPDGRVHPGFRISGTNTGRLSSYSPNGQNLPPDAKKIFVAPPGWKFVQFDYTNLELVVLAYFANIPYLIDVFERGLNVHDENTKRFLGISKSDPNWEEWRRVMKMYVFGRNYGGGLKGMYRRMLTAIPGLQMTFKQFCELDEKYFKLMPEYGVWYDETIDVLRRTRELTNAFGRVRIFLGPIDAIVREGLNFPIQGTAADIMAFGLIDFTKVYRVAKAQGAKMQLCLSVHDSAVVLAPEPEIAGLLHMYEDTFCAPRQIGDHEIPFRGEVKIMDDLKGEKKDEKTLTEWIDIYDRRTA